MTANQKRVRQARCALKAYGHNRHLVRTDFYETEEAITDLIADLYQLAQSENIDVEAMGGKLSLVAKFPDRDPVILSGIVEDGDDPKPTRRKRPHAHP
jgi:hypothetical protein